MAGFLEGRGRRTAAIVRQRAGFFILLAVHRAGAWPASQRVHPKSGERGHVLPAPPRPARRNAAADFWPCGEKYAVFRRRAELERLP